MQRSSVQIFLPSVVQFRLVLTVQRGVLPLGRFETTFERHHFRTAFVQLAQESSGELATSTSYLMLEAFRFIAFGREKSLQFANADAVIGCFAFVFALRLTQLLLQLTDKRE